MKARPPSSEREREEVGLDKRAIGSGFQPLTIPSTVGGGRKRLLAGVEKNSGGNSVNPSVGFNRLRRTQSSIMGRKSDLEEYCWGMEEGVKVCGRLSFFFFLRGL